MKIHDLAYVLISRPDTATSLLSRITETVNNSSAVIILCLNATRLCES